MAMLKSSYSVVNMDIGTDNIIANLNLEDIKFI